MHGLVFLATSHHHLATEQESLSRTKDVFTTQKIPRDLGVLCQEAGSKIGIKDAPSSLIT